MFDKDSRRTLMFRKLSHFLRSSNIFHRSNYGQDIRLPEPEKNYLRAVAFNLRSLSKRSVFKTFLRTNTSLQSWPIIKFFQLFLQLLCGLSVSAKRRCAPSGPGPSVPSRTLVKFLKMSEKPAAPAVTNAGTNVHHFWPVTRWQIRAFSQTQQKDEISRRRSGSSFRRISSVRLLD